MERRTRSVVPWKLVAYFLIACVLLQLVFPVTRPRDAAASLIAAHQAKQNPQVLKPAVAALPLDILGEIRDNLTSAQCDEFFPDLYFEVDRAVEYWRTRGHIISEADLDISWREDEEDAEGGVRILVHENELRILESRHAFGHPGMRSRVVGLLYLIHDALADATRSGEKLPTIEASILLRDFAEYPTDDGTHSYWAFTAGVANEAHKRHWLVPNWDFFAAGSVGSFQQTRRGAKFQDQPFISKIQKLVWRGTVWLNEEIRGALMDVADGQDWADVANFDWDNPKATWLTMNEICRYAMTVYTEGASYSGRLKFLLDCNSLPVIHKLDWRTSWSHLLKPDGPDQNYVAVSRDFSDLEEKVHHYMDRPDEAQRIVDNSLATFRNRYLEPVAQTCYIRRLIRGYSTVSFTPDHLRPTAKGRELGHWRGLSYGEYMVELSDMLEEDLYKD